MKKHFTILVSLSLALFVVAGLVDFTERYMEDFYDVPKYMAEALAPVIVKDSEDLGIDPLLIVAILQHETRFVNTFGDGGDAVGIAQLHKEAVYYVSNFFPYISYKVKQIGDHNKLIKYPVLQVKIAIRYLYLMKNNFNVDIITAIGKYNGQVELHNIYTNKVLSEYVSVLTAYNEYKLIKGD